MSRRSKRGAGVESQGGEGSRVGGAWWWVAAALLGLGVAGWIILGQARQRQVEGTVRTITQGVQDASANIQDKFAEAQTSARNLGLQQQIEARLHGEKTFDANQIEVHVEEENTAILKGLVPDATAKEKAVALTRDTRGVNKVVDQLAVVPPARVIVAPPADDNVPADAGRPRPLR